MYAVVGEIPRERSQWLCSPGLAQNAPYSLLVLVNAEPVTGKTELRGHAVKRHCPLLAECPFAAENSNAFHQQLGKAPLDITSEVTRCGLHLQNGFCCVEGREFFSSFHCSGNFSLNIMTFSSHAQIRAIVH